MADADYSNEIWKDIPGWEGLYQASSRGRVRSLERKSWNGAGWFVKPGRMLTQARARDGYFYVEFNTAAARKREGVHRAVCLAFHGDHRPLHVAHGDGDKSNNLPENLRWVRRDENELDKVAHGRRRGRQCLTEDEVRAIRVASETNAALAKQFGVTPENISSIRLRKTWKHIV